MILELLSFLPMLHEDYKMGSYYRRNSNTVTDSFSSSYTFWEQIEATYNLQVERGYSCPHVIPFRDSKGRLKEIIIFIDYILFNKDLEKENPADLEKWIMKYHLSKKDSCGYGSYPIYNHDGEFVEGFRFQLENDSLVYNHSTTEKEFNMYDPFVKWTPIMTRKEYYKKIGFL